MKISNKDLTPPPSTLEKPKYQSESEGEEDEISKEYDDFMTFQYGETPETKSSLRLKAEKAKKNRCNTLICVLENPRNISNIASVIRNIDALGISKMYVVDGHKQIPGDWNTQILNHKFLKKISSSACKWAYIKRFDSTTNCFAHLERNHYVSMCTSPHIKGETNTDLYQGDYTQKHLAIWFGNESEGISEEVVKKCQQCIQIEMGGIIESLNLSVSTGIVLWYIARKRGQYSQNKLETKEKSKEEPKEEFKE